MHHTPLLSILQLCV